MILFSDNSGAANNYVSNASSVKLSIDGNRLNCSVICPIAFFRSLISRNLMNICSIMTKNVDQDAALEHTESKDWSNITGN